MSSKRIKNDSILLNGISPERKLRRKRKRSSESDSDDDEEDREVLKSLKILMIQYFSDYAEMEALLRLRRNIFLLRFVISEHFFAVNQLFFGARNVTN